MDAPTLEAFGAEFDPDGALSESDLIVYFQEAHQNLPQTTGYRPRQLSKERLRQRQLAALHSLESALLESPKLNHSLAGWFEPALVARLEMDGMSTVNDVVNRCNRDGHRWWTKVKGLGEVRAKRITQWLAANVDHLGHVVSPRALYPRRQLAEMRPDVFSRPSSSSVVPLESLVVPSGLSGATGLNRASPGRKQINANNDFDAIQSWIESTTEAGSHTRRAYRTQAERLLLWAVFARGKALSSLNTDDARLFRDFLQNPEPAEMWIGPHGTERWSPMWRPFTGPLSAASCRLAIAAVRSMCEWFTQQHYLANNPFRGIRRPTESVNSSMSGTRDPGDRSLTVAQWHYLINEAYPSISAALTADAARARFLLLLGSLTGLRLSEIVKATTHDLRTFDSDERADMSKRWYLQVIGKGGKLRRVPLASALLEALRAYLAQRGFVSPLVSLSDPRNVAVPLIGRLDDKESTRALSASTLGETFKRIFQKAAAQLAETDQDAGHDLSRASAHWLRHTHASHSIRLGTSVAIARDNLGHASIATTSRYTHIELIERWNAIEEFSRKMI
ncbi:phage integrase family protein [Caballeronia sp. LP003]|uniref:phage integrase family protein n=1 Tax=Caballeronia sp. LP003 TaxID=3038551 RepID=UPI002857D0D1|nr:phage integrase family protein [Caballeronia sp. LP003]MDR5791680.1 phage integrase family protein [Caballeronia sp. LP003]